MTSSQATTNRVTFNCAKHDDLIKSVTVFQSNRAEVKREVNLGLKRGQNHIRIERLPSCIHEDSIRVDGTGTAIIFDVIYHALSNDHATQASTNADLRHALELLQNERAIAQEQSEFLGSYGRTLNSKTVNVEDVQRFLDMFGLRQLEVAKRIQELDLQIDKMQEELNEARRKEYEDFRGAQRGAAITVTVLAEMDGPVELMLTYAVSNASWTPLYDVRASIAKTPRDISTIGLHYRASITQTTGENWADVALSLSTASPQLGSAVPELAPWRIGFLPPVTCQPVARSADPNSGTRSHRGVDGSEMETGMYRPSRRRIGIRQAYVQSTSILNATFGIPGRINIPSDEGSHKVVIAVLDLQADLGWICVPRENESVYLTCKVMNSSEFTLLPGEASVFMDNSFVSKSRINHISPNESFETSLGVDPALRVTYPVAKTLNRTTTQSGFSLMAKEHQSVSCYSQRISIRNSRPTFVSVQVMDHVPVSTDAQLGVNLVSPKGLGDSRTSPSEGVDEGKRKEHTWKDVWPGVKARWATSEDTGGAVEWSCDIAPSDEVEMVLAWEVSAPAGQKWQDV
ncbi:unnamed protein product [Rhizoctonia solani]|uniref:Protein F37C4,5 [Caenorhabditis elegans] n=1 Tax=Rhizoctonia solani TaxID=456999 RepID=A0A8H2ZZ08_9AGAM|nr:unnamed protein product [Rhizoctonia solani]